MRWWWKGSALAAGLIAFGATAWAGHETWQSYGVVHVVVNGRPV